MPEERQVETTVPETATDFQDARETVMGEAATTDESRPTAGLVSTGYVAKDEYTYKAAQEIINRYKDCTSAEDAMRIVLQKRGEHALARDMGLEQYRRDNQDRLYRIDILHNEFNNLFIEHSKVLRLQAGVESLIQLRDNQSLAQSDIIKTADTYLRGILGEVDGLYGAHDLEAKTRKLLTQLEHYDAANRATATGNEQSKCLRPLFKGIRAIERSLAKSHPRLVGTTSRNESIASESRRKQGILGSLDRALWDYGTYLGSIQKPFNDRIKAVEAELAVLEASERAYKDLEGENQPMHPKHKVEDRSRLRQTIETLERIKEELSTVVKNIESTRETVKNERGAIKEAREAGKERKATPITDADRNLGEQIENNRLAHYGSSTMLGGNAKPRNVSPEATYKVGPLIHDGGWRKPLRKVNGGPFKIPHTIHGVRTEHSSLRSGRTNAQNVPDQTKSTNATDSAKTVAPADSHMPTRPSSPSSVRCMG